MAQVHACSAYQSMTHLLYSLFILFLIFHHFHFYYIIPIDSNLHRFLECQYDYVDKDCGSEARRFIEKHLEKATHPLMSRHCSIFTSNFKANCNLSNDLTDFNNYMFNHASDAYKVKLIWLSALLLIYFL
jgi:hypothetical protein